MPSGVIHDIGYQRYTGPRLGRGYASRSLYLHGLRTAFGLGRSAKAKIFPWATAGLAVVVATVLTAIRAQAGRPLVSYADFPSMIALLTTLFCAAAAPELVSRDLRGGVLPLYFSRPLRRSDYALAKLGALVTAVWLMLAGPLVLMLVGGVFSVHGAGAVGKEIVHFLPGLAQAAFYAAVYGSLSLLVASLAGRRAVAAAVVVAVFIVTTPIVGVIAVIGGPTAQKLAFLASPTTVVQGVGTWLFGVAGPEVRPYGPVYGLAMVVLLAACLLLLLARYRRVAR
ncbi:ABC transporter permease [Planosporangium thailandense]|uniref:ABC transporter permease n=1 Tax=Planosporangium thailandense TaxID=765197 RepID=A0ABX0XST2_9ACTN|nr:ABC transporter permease subunit [Planosporangium thailandense]NJC68412.1 ABC transporter permease [Planosporangium thailandense]